MIYSIKCYKDDKNSIKEIEGGEENDEDEENINNKKNENIEEEPVFSNEIDILDI